MTISELEMREEEEEEGEKVVIPCIHHKTASQGLAQLVVTEEIEEVLIYYLDNVRKKIVLAEKICKDKFFLSFNGGMYTQVYRRLKEGLSVGNLHPPVPSHYRVLVLCEAQRYLPEKEQRNVVKHLSHSMQTSEKYYEFMSTRDTTAAYSSIENLSVKRKWPKNVIT